MSGVVYQVTCKPTGLKYIGQATNYKYKNGNPYNYGASGRWNDHISSSKSRNTPLCQAIQQYGKNEFIIEILDELPLEELDEREAYWILQINTIYPNGYNVATHSRNRHRDSSNLHIFYEGKVQSAIISPIKQNGEFKLAYVYLNLHTGVQERLAFGQKLNQTYEETLDEAKEFLNKIRCPYTISKKYSNVLSEKYALKLKDFENKIITSIRITSASNLIAVYIGTSDMKLSKEHIRICFGGKTIKKEDAYETAKQFVAELQVPENIIIDFIQCRQQVTAL